MRSWTCTGTFASSRAIRATRRERSAAARLLVALLAMMLCGAALACGEHLSLPRAATPSPSPTPALHGGEASGAAQPPAATGLAAPARPAAQQPALGAATPPSRDGTCPASHPIKIGHDELAHPPGSAGYDLVTPIACYTTATDAALSGYPSATPGP